MGKRCGERHEAGAGHARGAFGGEHGDDQDAKFLADRQRRVGRLGKEQRRQRHIDVGAVEVE